jgi:hypothetical protein
MAHSFDTGAAKPQRTRIRQGAVSLLSGLKRPTGYLVEVMPTRLVVRSWRDEVGCAMLYATLVRFPSIAIAVGDRSSEVKGIGGYQERGELELLLYHASNNARAGVAGRQEIDSGGLAADTADPGLDVIMDHAKELILGQRLDSGSDIKQVRPDHEEQLYTAAPVEIWLQAFKVTTNVQISEFRTVTQLLESIRFRLATNPAEVHLPTAKTDSNTVDINVDDLA